MNRGRSFGSLAVFGFAIVIASSAPFAMGQSPRPSEGASASARDGSSSAGGKFAQADKFRQLEEILPTPNGYRTGSGAPGPAYWQQKADYVIDVELDEKDRKITGAETITYSNQSPEPLKYLWLQLDPNLFAPGSDRALTSTGGADLEPSLAMLKMAAARETFDGGIKIAYVRDEKGSALPHTIVKTMMRIDLKEPLPPGKPIKFAVGWSYRINDSKLARGRTGFEMFDEDGNAIFEIAQWFPRMAAYNDVAGWQHKQYLGAGEFTLELGDYDVRITVPNDHIVASTGELRNPDQVLTPAQKQRLEQAKTAAKPVFIVSPDEAKANEKSKPSGKKTWAFQAKNVRDFAFATSRKFIWDAQGHQVGANPSKTMAMSFYPKEGEPLWSQYSTHAIIHTLNVYSRYTFDYPYPVAISVNGPVGGMEYPMICFNGPRPGKDGKYSKRTKYALISVIIHEVGHNYFPMIVNTDERQWTWMDEGINTFLQYLSEQEWENGYPSSRGEPKSIVPYMKSRDQVPIMTNSESLLQFGNNAYGKPATALNVLRETVLGRELFDFAFKEYATRWKFKRPMPADFFRTMEDASGVDLDWFWRGWFYSTDHCDIAIEDVRMSSLELGGPGNQNPSQDAKKDQPQTLSQTRNRTLPKRIEQFPELKDIYNKPEAEGGPTPQDREAFEKFLKELKDEEKELLKTPHYFYAVEFRNIGGLVMPVLLEVKFEDGSTQEVRIPAEVWRYDNEKITKLLRFTKPVESITLDPHLETADVDTENNVFPQRPAQSKFQAFKSAASRNADESGNDSDNADPDASRKSQRPRRGGRPQ